MSDDLVVVYDQVTVTIPAGSIANPSAAASVTVSIPQAMWDTWFFPNEPYDMFNHRGPVYQPCLMVYYDQIFERFNAFGGVEVRMNPWSVQRPIMGTDQLTSKYTSARAFNGTTVTEGFVTVPIFPQNGLPSAVWSAHLARPGVAIKPAMNVTSQSVQVYLSNFATVPRTITNLSLAFIKYPWVDLPDPAWERTDVRILHHSLPQPPPPQFAPAGGVDLTPLIVPQGPTFTEPGTLTTVTTTPTAIPEGIYNVAFVVSISAPITQVFSQKFGGNVLLGYYVDAVVRTYDANQTFLALYSMASWGDDNVSTYGLTQSGFIVLSPDAAYWDWFYAIYDAVDDFTMTLDVSFRQNAPVVRRGASYAQIIG